MSSSKWGKYNNQTITTTCEILFISQDNQICQGTVKSLPLSSNEVVVAYRELEIKQQPKVLERKFVCYWNWKKGKFWPFNAKTPPNPKLPHYFRIEINYNNPKELKYFIHSEVIV